MISLLFPKKCVFCRKLLVRDEKVLCPECEKKPPVFRRAKRNIPFIAHWTALWYYKDKVRPSIRRFKFYNFRFYAKSYAELLCPKIENDLGKDFDILSWTPVSFRRKLHRGYDQAQLLAVALGRKLDMQPVRVLKKIRHTPPQSSIRDPAQRRANVLGAYRVIDPALVKGKRILLIDDVVTTGATASECAKTLMFAGAKEVIFAAVAAAE